MLKIAIAFENFAGAGHAGIVSKLAQSIDDIGGETVCITGSGLPTGSGRFFNFPVSTRFVALPTIEKDPATGRAELTARGLTYDQDIEFQQKRTEKIITGLRHERPQILVTDSWPFGKGNLDTELLPVLDTARQLDIQIVPMVRDVGFYPQHRKNMSSEQIDGHIAAIVNNQTRGILITGDQNLFRLEDWYPQAADTMMVDRFYPGYFSQPPKQRHDFVSETDRPVVFSLGGGFVPEPDLNITQAVLSNHEKSPWRNHPLWFFLSPDCPERHAETIKSWADQNNKIVMITDGKSDDYQQAIADSVASISTCGLNTCVEVMRSSMVYNTPIIFIPRYKGGYSLDQEQTFRAKKLDDIGISTNITATDYADESAYLNRLEKAQNRPVIANMNYEMNGSENAAHILANMADDSMRYNIERFRKRPKQSARPHSLCA